MMELSSVYEILYYRMMERIDANKFFARNFGCAYFLFHGIFRKIKEALEFERTWLV